MATPPVYMPTHRMDTHRVSILPFETDRSFLSRHAERGAAAGPRADEGVSPMDRWLASGRRRSQRLRRPRGSRLDTIVEAAGEMRLGHE